MTDKHIAILGILSSGFFSWLFTFLYYRKSLSQQSVAASRQLARLIDLAAQADGTSRQLVMQKRLEDAFQEYRHAGTPYRAIESYTDLTNDEKAELFDAVILRAKGRRARSNPYRSK